MKGITMDLVMQLKDPSGKVVMEKKLPCHTFLKNFAEIIWIALFLRGNAYNSATVTKREGTSEVLRTTIATNNIGDYSVAAGCAMRCRIGIGTQAFNRTDFDVQTYEDSLIYAQYEINDDGTQKTLTISFSWLNDTGGSKDITEACLICYYFGYTSATVKDVALTRDVFSAVTVADGYTMALGYVITFPW